MHYSTAQHRLRKMIMFMLIKRLKLDLCYRCNKPIVTFQDLSIDHKKDWLDKDIRRFWDLGNIAFSHLSCNSAASRYAGKRYEHKIGDRCDEEGHYPSRTWYDRGCRCIDCKEVKKLSRKKHNA